MFSITRFISPKGNVPPSDSSAKKTRGKGGKHPGFSYLRAGLGLLLLSSLWLAVITAGAAGNRNIMQPNASAEGKKGRYVNVDIRVNGGRENLIKAIGRENLVKFGEEGNSLVARSAIRQSESIKEGISRLKNETPSAEVKLSGVTGAVEVVRSSGALTDVAPGRTGEDIVRGFIRNNNELYGLSEKEIGDLNFLGESISPESGMRMVRVEQRVNGHSVFQSETRFILDAEGRLIRSTGLLIPKASDYALPLENLISPEDGLRATMQRVDINLDDAQMSVSKKEAGDLKTKIIVDDARITDEVTSQIVYFPVAPGVLVPAYSQVIFGEDADWYALADARDGTLLWRKNIRNSASTHDARFRVYVQADGTTPADSPAPLSPTTVTPGSGFQPPGIAPTIVSMFMAQSTVASPNGWINDCPAGGCTANETQTIGNNVHAYVDLVQGAGAGGANQPDTTAAGVLDGNGKPTGNPDTNGRNRDFFGTAPRDFQTNYLPPPQGGNPEAGQSATGNGNNGTLPIDQFRRGVVTQLFYVSNWYHDKLYNLGFNEAAGNFQQTNFSGMGLGNDRVLAEAVDGSGTNNANFATPPDGTSGRMQMFRFTGPTVDRDGSLDTEIVIHELTHGLSNRLVGNAAGLNWDIGAGMGEGWSDFYALSLLNNTNADDPNANYASGAYATYKLGGLLDNYLYGIRRFPYSTNNAVNPLTWADTDDITNNLSGGIAPSPLNFNGGGALEVHNSGEVWALSLWEVRSRIIAANGGSVPTGNQITLRLVTDAMKLTPISPSFTDGRDALIDADCATNACANEQAIWDGFADRGLGYKAYAPVTHMFGYTAGHASLKESFDAPNLDAVSYTIDDSFGNNNGFIDPNEPIKLTVSLKNPWRNASKSIPSATATLTTSTAGVTVVDNTSTYGAIAANATAAPNAGDTFSFIAPANAADCGKSLNFTIATSSALGSGTTEITLRVGQASGTGTPVTYTSNPEPNIAIPDNSPRGSAPNTLAITDDLQIADVNFRVDSITHTFTGDLTVLLKGPNGYGTDFVSVIGGLTDGGPGDNIVNMVIDDEAAAPNDQLAATAAQAPYTDDFLPAFNSPSWATAGFGPPDPVGNLSRFDGISTKGNWTVLASDQFGGDTGTLNQWSIIVTPVNFVCTAPVVAQGPTVTINQAAGQPDPTSTSPINFTVVFSQPVTGFTGSDVQLSGTAGATTATVTQIAPNNGTTYNVAVSGMTQNGTVIATVPAGVAVNEFGTGNQASTSTDNVVTYLANADLALSLVVSPDPVARGANLTYTMTLTNNGAAAQNIVLSQSDYFRERGGTRLEVSSITAPAGFTCRTGGAFFDPSFAEVVCSGASLGAGQSVQFTIVKRQRTPLPRGIRIYHEASVRSSGTEANTANNEATDSTLVQ